MIRYTSPVLFILLFFFPSRAQNDLVSQKAAAYILDRQGVFSNVSLKNDDFYITSSHVSSLSGVRHIYYQQRLDGLDIVGAVGSVHLSGEDKITNATSSFIDLGGYKLQRAKSLDHRGAISRSAAHLKLKETGETGLVRESRDSSDKQVFVNPTVSSREIPVKVVYLPVGDRLLLSFEVFVDNPQDGLMWLIYVNAQSGAVEKSTKLTTECDFGPGHTLQQHAHIIPAADPSDAENHGASDSEFAPNSYLVYPIPLEAPNEGPQSVVTDPADLTASPFGWHDVNGVAGAEFTVTRGNNVWAYEDQNDDDLPGLSPDGGANLEFNFPVDTSMHPFSYTSGAITNLFYMNNIMHDVLYLYGFDEAAGNFQVNNYGNGGSGNDQVLAEAQDGSGLNNANFGTPVDGFQPRMQMYRWGTTMPFLTVQAPVNISGSYNVSGADFNPILTASGNVVLAEPINGCTAITNASEIAGKIAMIDRGSCNFIVKADNAIAAGAIGVIICNHLPGTGTITMGNAGDPTIRSIPSVMLSYEDCQVLKPEIPNGLQVSLGVLGSQQTDSDLDNGIIAHEYGHGISNRLTGGSANVGCLGVNEQMGEGWSDYYALLLQMKPTDMAADVNGIGTYVLGESAMGDGIRPFPYSTDLQINPLTYNDIAGLSIPHGVGSVWCTMLWDMTWNLINKHGFEPDIYATTGGNGISMQLVTEGMKLQPCSPGFVDGRNAILMADTLIFGGANACEIWSAFARRGLGVGASQGSSNLVNDGVESYLVPASCPQPCTDLSLSYSAVTIPDATNRKVQTSINIDNSIIQMGDAVNLSAEQGILIEPTFDVGTTAELLLDTKPCDESFLPMSARPLEKKLDLIQKNNLIPNLRME